MSEAIWYVYGVVACGADVSGAPPGVDDAAVRLEREGELAALVSTLDAVAYAEATIEEQSGDVDWLAPRATAHDRVLTWASDAGPVAPLPLLSLFRDASGVRAMLRERRQELEQALERAASGREYHLRVFRDDRRLAEHLATLSPRIAELQTAAAKASPGQQYLLGRKLADERRAELRRVGGAVAREIHETLRARSLASATDPMPKQGAESEHGAAVLKSAYLVAPAQLDAFRAALTEIMARREAEGFRFDFTGPWPVYHFV